MFKRKIRLSFDLRSQAAQLDLSPRAQFDPRFGTFHPAWLWLENPEFGPLRLGTCAGVVAET